MKKFLVFAMLFLAPAIAFADIDQTTIGEYVVVGGYVPSHFPMETRTQIQKNGIIVQIKKYSDNREVRTLLGRLAPELVANFIEKAAHFSPSQLVVSDPNAPICADAPAEFAKVANRQGELVDLSGKRDCRVLVRADQEASYELSAVLEAASHFSYLLPPG